MKTYIHLKMSNQYPLPSVFQDDDVRYPESLVEHFLEEYTHVGDVIFDPFAGFGTTLLVAERMGRIPLGVEIEQNRVDFVRSKLSNSGNIIQGDSRVLATIDLPAIDFSITSPPYMTKNNHPENPFTGYKAKGKGYKAYLRDIHSIYEQLRKHMKSTGMVVVEVSNLKVDGQVTTLAWDIGQEISQVLHFNGEVIVCWDKYGYGYDHSYCLVFSVQ
ncbi:MAG: TRM11 family SAM-dependent methyltransferase [Chloroflexota bacterium]